MRGSTVIATHDLSERAVRAAVGVAAVHGVRAAEPVVVADGFNVVVWLRPAPVVARIVGLPALLRSTVDAMIEREIAVARFLDGQGIPVVRPSQELPSGPHRCDGLWLSFWERLEVEPGAPSPAEAGARLRELHGALREYQADSPVLDVPIRDLETFLDSGLQPSEMSTKDIELIGRKLEAIRPELTTQGPTQQLHGDAHPGNLVRVRDSWVWIDLEESMRGPVEWDLATMRRTDRLDGAEAVRAYGADEATLRPFQTLRQLQGTVWMAILATGFPTGRPVLARNSRCCEHGDPRRTGIGRASGTVSGSRAGTRRWGSPDRTAEYRQRSLPGVSARR